MSLAIDALERDTRASRVFREHGDQLAALPLHNRVQGTGVLEVFIELHAVAA